MTRDFTFTLSLTVHDEQQLLAAARAHPDAEGTSPDEFLDEEGNVDHSACLVMLLDPSTLPGCEIHDSSAEEDVVFHVDFQPGD